MAMEKAIVGVVPRTVKVVVAEPAAKFPEATWFAVTLTCPLPVSVSVVPEIVAGPLATE